MNTINTGYYQIIFTLFFNFRILEIIKFYKKYNYRVKQLELNFSSIYNGFLESFKRTRILYLFNISLLFFQNIYKSPKNTIIKTKHFLLKKLLN